MIDRGKAKWLHCLLLLPVAILFLLLSRPGYALDVTLAWSGNWAPDIASYKIYYNPGTSGGRKLGNYKGKDAKEGESPIEVLLADDENSDPDIVQFTVHDLDNRKNYYVVVAAFTTDGLVGNGSREVKIFGSDDIKDRRYNRGWAVTSGEFKGFEVFYHTDHLQTPTLGISNEIEGFLEGYRPLGKPLNLQPSGTIFKEQNDPNDLRPPVTVFIPCTGYSRASGISVFLYDEVNRTWFLAADGEGNIQINAEDWLAATPLPHDHDPADDLPARIEVQLYHFSGVQAGVPVPQDPQIFVGGGDSGCLIDALTE